MTGVGLIGFGLGMVVFCKIGGATGNAPAAIVGTGRVTVTLGRAVCAAGVAGLGTRTLGLLVATAVGTGLSGAKTPGTGGSGVEFRITTLGAVLVGATEGNAGLRTVGSGAEGGARVGVGLNGFAFGTLVGRGANGLTLRGALGRTTCVVAVLEAVGVAGLPVGGVTGVVASRGICCTSRVRLGVTALEVGVAGVFGSVAIGVTAGVVVGSAVDTGSFGVWLSKYQVTMPSPSAASKPLYNTGLETLMLLNPGFLIGASEVWVVLSSGLIISEPPPLARLAHSDRRG